MNIWRLAIREARHRVLNGVLTVVGASVAVATVVASLLLLVQNEQRVESMLARKATDLRSRLSRLERDIDAAMRGLGFNVTILPKAEELADWYARGFCSETMPEAYVDHLRAAGLVTLERLTPVLSRKVRWPETRWTVLLVGTDGEDNGGSPADGVAAAGRVVAGRLRLGYQLHQGLGRRVGDTVELFGRAFVVDRCVSERGTQEDITVWLSLRDAQQLLDLPGRINEIRAHECRAAWADLPKIRDEMARVLPDTQVVEHVPQALANLMAQGRAARQSDAVLTDEGNKQWALRQARRRFVAWAVTVVVAVCAVWLGLLAIGNVRERREEVGILRSTGFRSRQILGLFLSRAVVLGIPGGVVGFLVGVLVSVGAAAGAAVPWKVAAALFVPAVVLAPAMAAVAGWLPALLAARQDPAMALREERIG